MKDRISILNSYNEELFKIYEEFDLKSLEDNDFKIREINVLTIPIKKGERSEKLIPTILLWDLNNCLNDLKYFTGNLFLYLDHINNPLDELFYVDDKFISSTYFQNMFDRRYSLFITCCFEKAYNYWDRIGDILHSHYQDLLKPHQVDFNRIIDSVSKLDVGGEYFDWLLSFKENEYKILNNYRREFVHYYQFESKYRYNHTMNSHDLEFIEKIFLEKINFPEYFKNHLKLCLEGIYNFIEIDSN